MIILNNHSKSGTYVIIENSKYRIMKKENSKLVRHGVGGFTEDKEIVGIYLHDDKLYFMYNNTHIEVNQGNLICTNTKLKEEKRHFQVTFNSRTICNIIYKPYINSFILTHDEDEDEYDVLLYLSNLMKNEDSIERFVKGMKSINQ